MERHRAGLSWIYTLSIQCIGGRVFFEGWILMILKPFYQFSCVFHPFLPILYPNFQGGADATCTLHHLAACDPVRGSKAARSLRTRIKIISDRGASAGSGDQRRYRGTGQKWLVYDDGFNLQTREQCSLWCWCAEYTAAAAAGVAEIPKS